MLNLFAENMRSNGSKALPNDRYLISPYNRQAQSSLLLSPLTKFREGSELFAMARSHGVAFCSNIKLPLTGARP